MVTGDGVDRELEDRYSGYIFRFFVSLRRADKDSRRWGRGRGD